MGCSSSKTSTKSAMDSKSKTLMTALASGSKTKTFMTPETEVKSVKTNVVVPEGKVSVDVTKLLNEIFDQLDANGDGFVSKKELAASLDHVLECSHVKSEKSFKTLLAESHLNPYLSTFEQLDTNHDGKISREEFQANMHPSEAVKHVEQHLKDMFDSIDTNKNGNLSRKEFSKAFNNLLTQSCLKSGKSFKTLMIDAGLNSDVFASEESCDAAMTTFQALDANKDGMITWAEFRSKLQPAFDSMEFLRSVFNQMDADGDGAVSKKELTVSFERILNCSEIKSKKSFRRLLQEAGLNAEFYVFERLLDTNADGRITWDEFEASFKPAASQPDTEESVAKQATAADFLYETEGKTVAVVEEDEASASVACLCGGW